MINLINWNFVHEPIFASVVIIGIIMLIVLDKDRIEMLKKEKDLTFNKK